MKISLSRRVPFTCTVAVALAVAFTAWHPTAMADGDLLYWRLHGATGNGWVDDEPVVARTESEYRVAWSKLHTNISAPAAAPHIDFQRELVVFVPAGMKSRGGHAITIERVVEFTAAIQVIAALRIPGAGCMVTQAMEAPVAVLRMDKRDKPVRVSLTSRVHDCQ